MKNIKIGMMLICLLLAILTINKLGGIYLNINDITGVLKDIPIRQRSYFCYFG